MLRFGNLRTRDCGGITRRAALTAGMLGALRVGLPSGSWGANSKREVSATNRRMILLWLWGGPPHLDTFDMKPNAPLEYRGPYRPVSTNVPGIEICELLPRLTRLADKYALIRSLRHDNNDHGIAGTIGLTNSSAGGASLGGVTLPGQLLPTHGAIVSRARNGTHSELPRFMTIGGHLHQGHRPIRGEGGGILGAPHDPFRLDYDPDEGPRVPELKLISGVTAEGLTDRRRLVRELDDARRHFENSPAIEKLDQHYQRAFSLLTSGAARRFFDLDQESATTRIQYGRYRFGQCCLMARRLIEAGVSFAQVNWSSHVEPIEDAGDGGWDMHDRNFPQLQDRHAWMLDRSLSALLTDLDERGLLESTVVLAIGEFGRTPKINPKAGRDHWEHCYSALVAGGGLRVGQVIGSSDQRGEYPASRKLHPGDLATTLYHQLGIGTTDLTSFGLVPPGQVVEELV